MRFFAHTAIVFFLLVRLTASFSLDNLSWAPAPDATLFAQASLDALESRFEFTDSQLLEASNGEVSLSTPLVFASILSQNASWNFSDSGMLYSASGGLVGVVNDGCYDSGGQDQCLLHGYGGPGSFSWCSPCDYFHPQCGNSELHDYCYRFLAVPAGNYSIPSQLTQYSYDVGLSLANFSCTLSDSVAQCGNGPVRFSLIASQTLNHSVPTGYFLPIAGGYARLDDSLFSAYQSAYVQFLQASSLPQALSAQTALQGALTALLSNARGNETQYTVSPNASWVNLSITMSLNGSDTLRFLHGYPAISQSGVATSNGSHGLYPFALENRGFADDNFSLQLQCENGTAFANSSFHFTLPSRSSQSVSFPLPPSNAPYSCQAQAFVSQEPRLSQSWQGLLQTPPQPSPTPVPPSSYGGSSTGGGITSRFSSPDVSPSAPSSPTPSPAPELIPTPARDSILFIPVDFDSQPGSFSENYFPSSASQTWPPYDAPPAGFSFTGLSLLPSPYSLQFLAPVVLAVSILALSAFAFIQYRDAQVSVQCLPRGEWVEWVVHCRRPLQQVRLTLFAPAPVTASPPADEFQDTVLGYRMVWRRASLLGVWRLRYPRPQSQGVFAPQPLPAVLEFERDGISRKLTLRS